MLPNNTATASGETQVFSEIKLYAPTDWGQPKFHFGQRVTNTKKYSLRRSFVGFVDSIFYDKNGWGYAVTLPLDDDILETVSEDQIEAI
jgi:hypothetical protein